MPSSKAVPETPLSVASRTVLIACLLVTRSSAFPDSLTTGMTSRADAVARGAAAIVCVRRPEGIGDVTVAIVGDTRMALAHASATFWGHPAHNLAVVGITGTNGKTTTAYLVDSIARAAGRRTGLIGTVETRIGEERLDAGRTTPESADLQALLARMRDADVQSVAMEVSSHAIDLNAWRRSGSLSPRSRT
jgi:UDP-N-acetylmuramoyl-L-alanyl-D-glutamate--2,6-diaminopimelate ligase